MDSRPLILTARFDPELADKLDTLRQLHFPAALNYLAAHLTLFHALPGLEIEQVRRDLQPDTPIESIDCVLPSVRFTGRGVQAVVHCVPLCSLRELLATRWHRWLSRQDQQSFRPHVTIQNKCDPPIARRLFEQLTHTWTPVTGRIIGLDLWHYAGGPWEPAGAFHLCK